MTEVHQPTEDMMGDIDPFAVADDPDDLLNDDQDMTVETVLIREIRDYLKEQLALHNSLDAIEPGGENVMTTQQQVQMHKAIVEHLRQIQQIIDNKVKEN